MADLAKVVLFLAVIVFVIVEFAATETAFRCEGKLTYAGQKQPATLFMTLVKYRWWVDLWSDGSDGMVTIEAPKLVIGHKPYFGLDDNGDAVRRLIGGPWAGIGEPFSAPAAEFRGLRVHPL